MVAVDYTEKLCNAYDVRREVQLAFTSSMTVLCRTILESNGIEVAAIESRTKTIESFRGKIFRPEKSGKYKKLDDITDLSGIRLILFLKDDCDSALKLLSENFLVDKKNSTNKADIIDPDRFGYLSTHLILSYGKDREGLIEFAPFRGLKAEIQIRTVLQHAWSAIDWRLRYKSEVEVPKQLRRKLYRISALLETADDEFTSLDAQVVSLRKEYSQKIREGVGDVEVDGDSVLSFLTEDAVWMSFLSKLSSAFEGVVLTDPGGHEGRTKLVVNLLQNLEIKDIKSLRGMIRSSGGKVMPAIKRIVSSYIKAGGDKISPEAVLRLAVLLANKPVPDYIIGSTVFVQGLKVPLDLELTRTS